MSALFYFDKSSDWFFSDQFDSPITSIKKVPSILIDGTSAYLIMVYSIYSAVAAVKP
jgi:hypothetical protein